MPGTRAFPGARSRAAGALDRMQHEPRFLTLTDVAEILNISTSQVYALVRSQELRAIKIGGRGQWRVERSELENYIQRMYEQTSDFIAKHPFIEASGAEPNGSD